MDWKVGDTARALYHIRKITYDQTGKPVGSEQIIQAGEQFVVNDILDGPCQKMLDIGISIPTKNLFCICDICLPPHNVPAKIEKGTQSFLLSSWFTNPRDTKAFIRIMKKLQENPDQKRRKFLISNPTLVPNFLPPKKSKETKKEEVLF